jgi:hypothetical protein
VSIYCVLRSDAESVSTTISQDSRGSNKENRPGRESRNSRDLDEEVVLRRKPEYNRVIISHNFFAYFVLHLTWTHDSHF